MVLLVTLLVISSLLGVIVLAVAYALSLKADQDSEKLSPFECGFVPMDSSRSPFSMQFFLISLIFLIFDIELILIFPFLVNVQASSNLFSVTTLWGFIVVLSAGLIVEWSQKMLEWYKY